MNFFEHQDRARSHTSKLVLLFAIAVTVLVLTTSFLVTLIVAWAEQGPPPELGLALLDSRIFRIVAPVIVGVVLLGALYRIIQLRRGGGRSIAEHMGGRLLERNLASADELKILNVVEEMALASGVPVPPVYLIADDAINAFAAGYHMHDAVIGITRGAIRLLKRDELQGVIAHEFSHIFNGDMRLNLRLVGWLHGLLMIGVIGRMILRAPHQRRRRDKNGGSLVLIGLALSVLGYTGILFGNLIKSAVSRQREFLADASAVQFTRNPEGIGNALKKIGGYPLGSRMLIRDATEINHMLFGEPVYGISIFGWFSTHPPLKERIKRIEPRWDGELINPDRLPPLSYSELPPDAQLSQAAPGMEMPATGSQLAERIVDSVGMPTESTLHLAQAHLAAIPDIIRQQLDNPLGAMLMMWALLISDSDDAVAAQQLALLHKQRTAGELKLLATQLEALRDIPGAMSHDIVALAQPLLMQLSATQSESFLKTLESLTSVDGRLSLHEWSLSRLLQHHLEGGWKSDKRLDISLCLADCHELLSALAHAGAHKGEAAHEALQKSYAMLDGGAQPASPVNALDFAALDKALQRLQKLKPLQKPKLLKAMVCCIQHDGHINEEEMSLLRVVAELLDCPIPPLQA